MSQPDQFQCYECNGVGNIGNANYQCETCEGSGIVWSYPAQTQASQLNQAAETMESQTTRCRVCNGILKQCKEALGKDGGGNG